ncbi:hypothetical protein L596_004096 [Steinernema carpocapsae]|uniref:Uncharacterized protein n=1 Tax=Steinernema carpocapsae TaxID=34508 RepID=A0A4U8UY67_STECR|nr:hypothetical protein L596_004096 [Steinernema carpocapsae]
MLSYTDAFRSKTAPGFYNITASRVKTFKSGLAAMITVDSFGGPEPLSDRSYHAQETMQNICKLKLEGSQSNDPGRGGKNIARVRRKSSLPNMMWAWKEGMNESRTLWKTL